MNINKPSESSETIVKSAVSTETFVFLIAFLLLFGFMGHRMGVSNMMNTIMNTAYRLLLDTVFYIMAIAVITGSIAGLMSEFGLIALINRIISPLMYPVYGLPGATIVGVLATYMSDNPAILTLASDHNFRRYFKPYQLPALTNVGTAFGMGMIVTVFAAGLRGNSGESFLTAALIGNMGAIVGSIVSTRLMLIRTRRIIGDGVPEDRPDEGENIGLNQRIVREGSVWTRFMEALLEGGKNGVSMGVSIIPGVLIICTIVLMLTNGPSASGAYTGEAYEGIGLLPYLAEKASFILNVLFGFSSPEAVSVPITALGAAGAAIGMIPNLLSEGLANGNDIAVFTAMCMCWSGYLSTHIAMMDSLGYRKLAGSAILSHTIGGLCAGISAHYLFLLL